MIRIIVRQLDESAACNVGGPVSQSLKTFDVELLEVETFLDEVPQWIRREVIGVELLIPEVKFPRHES